MSSKAPSGGNAQALAWAEEAHGLVQAQPRKALALAQRALAAASTSADIDAGVAARHALGWAQSVLGDARTGRTTLRTGIRLAEKHGDRRGAAPLRRLLAGLLADAGHMPAAQREIDAAVEVLSGLDRARSQVHRVAIHRRTNAANPDLHRQICADAATALRLLKREGDEIWEARLLFNRGLLRLDRGELHLSEIDLRRAQTLYSRVGAQAAAANTAVDLAELALLRGDVLGCLKMLDEVQATAVQEELSYTSNIGNLAECRAMALAQARLLPEARAAADAYLALGRPDPVAANMHNIAAIALMSSDPLTARQLAMHSARSFSARRNPTNAALARAVALRARLQEGAVEGSSVRAGLNSAAVLENAGWRRDAMRTRVLVARLALATGAVRTGRQQLDLAEPLWRRGTAADRIEICHARALLRIAEGKPAAAERLLEQGLLILDDYRAALGAVELRAMASGMGSELSLAGLRIAVASRKPAKILTWAERLRASALRLPSVRPPADAKLQAFQVELRRAVEQRATGRQTKLEAAIRERTRLADADVGVVTAVPATEEAAQLLGERVLIEYVELEERLYALTLAQGSLALHELGANTTRQELEWLRFALGRLAKGRLEGPQRVAVEANARGAALALDALLFAPIVTVIGDAPLVIVPTGALHGIPWSDLPSMHGRAVVVAPSLAVWLRLDKYPRSRRRKVAVIAGPGLRYAAREVREIGQVLPHASVLEGKAATAAAALAALDGAALAHLACHGHFRADSPLFSSLELADGPLNVYELQNLRHAPDVVVLSACDLATSDLHPGDELLGVAAALLGMGTRTIIASVVPVPDAAAKRLMIAFHRNLLAGDAPASALARAQARASVPGFVCLGSG